MASVMEASKKTTSVLTCDEERGESYCKEDSEPAGGQ